jgi:hypothetical protein
MEETQVKKKLYIHANLGVFANTRNRTKDRIKNRTNNIMKRSNHTKCHRVHTRLYFIFQQVWWHKDLYSLICQWTLHVLFRPIFRSVFYMSLPTIIKSLLNVNKWLESLFTHNVFTLPIYLCSAIFVFVFLVNVFNKEFNYMNNNCLNKLTFIKKSWCSSFNSVFLTSSHLVYSGHVRFERYVISVVCLTDRKRSNFYTLVRPSLSEP